MKLMHRILSICLIAVNISNISAPRNSSSVIPEFSGYVGRFTEVLPCIWTTREDCNRFKRIRCIVECTEYHIDICVQKYNHCYRRALCNATIMSSLEQELVERTAQPGLDEDEICEQNDTIMAEFCQSESEESVWGARFFTRVELRINQCELYGQITEIIKTNCKQRARCKTLSRELSELSLGVRYRWAVTRLQERLKVMSQKRIP